MKTTIGTIYEAFDGTKFISEHDCIMYETEQALLKTGFDIKSRYDELMKDIKHYCAQMVDEAYDDNKDENVCDSDICPFYKEDYPHNCMFSKLPYIDN